MNNENQSRTGYARWAAWLAGMSCVWLVVGGCNVEDTLTTFVQDFARQAFAAFVL
jgi:hypothetical protein